MDLSRMLLMLCTCYVGHVLCSGSLYDPPNRAVMWKYGFPTKTNYNYMQLNCGGEKQPEDGPRTCGVCGDPYSAPREHEKGGEYGTGMIGRYYPAGIREINVKVELLSFEKGFFEFRICPVNNGTVTQQCLDEHKLPIREGYLAGTPMRYYPEAAGDVRLTVAVLPDMTCDRCVLQWRYHTANSWGEDPENKKQGLGYGPQEEFYNCADIRIGGEIPSSVRANPFFAPQEVSMVADVQDAVVNTVAIGPQRVDHLQPGARAVLFDGSATGTGMDQTTGDMLTSSWSVNMDATNGGTSLVGGTSLGTGTASLTITDHTGKLQENVGTNSQQPTIGMVLTQSAGSQLSGQTEKAGTDANLVSLSQKISDINVKSSQGIVGGSGAVAGMIVGAQSGSLDLASKDYFAAQTAGATVGDSKRASLLVEGANVGTPTVGLLVNTSGPRKVGILVDGKSEVKAGGVVISSGTQQGTATISGSNIKPHAGEKTVSLIVDTVGIQVPTGTVIGRGHKQGDSRTVGLIVDPGVQRVGMIVDGNRKDSTVGQAGGLLIDMGSAKTVDVVQSGTSSGRVDGVGSVMGTGTDGFTPLGGTRVAEVFQRDHTNRQTQSTSVMGGGSVASSGHAVISASPVRSAATLATESSARADSVVYDPDTSSTVKGAHTLVGSTVDFSSEAKPRLTIERESMGTSGTMGDVSSNQGPSTAFTLDLRNLPERRVEGSRRLFNQVTASTDVSNNRSRTDARRIADQSVVNIEQQINSFDIARVPNGHAVEAGVQLTAGGTMTTGFGPRMEVTRTRGRRLPEDSFTAGGIGGDTSLPEGLIPGDRYRIVTDPRTGRQERVPLRSDVGFRMRESASAGIFSPGSDAFVDFGARDGVRMETASLRRGGDSEFSGFASGGGVRTGTVDMGGGGVRTGSVDMGGGGAAFAGVDTVAGGRVDLRDERSRRTEFGGRETGRLRAEPVRGGMIDAIGRDGIEARRAGEISMMDRRGSGERFSSEFIRSMPAGGMGGPGGGGFSDTRGARMRTESGSDFGASDSRAGSFRGETRRGEAGGRGEFESRSETPSGRSTFGVGGFGPGPSGGFMPMPPSMMPRFGMPGMPPGMPSMGLGPPMGPGMPSMGGPMGMPFGTSIGMPPPSMFGSGLEGMGFSMRR